MSETEARKRPKVVFREDGSPVFVTDTSIPVGEPQPLPLAPQLADAMPPAPEEVPVAASVPVPVPAPVASRGRAPTAAPEEVTVEEEEGKEVKPDGFMPDAEFADPAEWYRVQQERAQLADQNAELERSTQAQIQQAQEAQRRMLDENAARILDTMEATRQRTEEAVRDVQERSQALFSQQFDPRRIYHSPDSAASIGVHLGVAVGAMLAQINNNRNPGSNTPNLALGLVTDAIEQDIARQQEQFRRGQLSLDADTAAMRAMRELGADEVQAFEFARTSALQSTAVQLDAIASAHAGSQAGLAAADQAAQLRQQAMDRNQAIQMQLMQLAARRARSAPRQEEAEPINLDRTRYHLSTDPSQAENVAAFQALKPAQRNEILDAIDGHDNLASLVKDVQDMLRRGEIGDITVDDAAISRVNMIMTDLTAAYSHANHLGALDSGLTDTLEHGFGSPGDWIERASSLRARLGQARFNQIRARTRLTRRYGLDPVVGSESSPSTPELEENRVAHRDSDPETSHLSADREASRVADRIRGRAHTERVNDAMGDVVF